MLRCTELLVDRLGFSLSALCFIELLRPTEVEEVEEPSDPLGRASTPFFSSSVSDAGGSSEGVERVR